MVQPLFDSGSPQVISMLGNSYPSAGGPLSQSHVQTVNNLNSMGMLNDVNSGDSTPFDINDFPQLTSRPSSAGGPQGQLGVWRKMLFCLIHCSPSTKKNNVNYKFQVLYENRVLELVPLSNKTKSLVFKMKTSQLYQDSKVLYIVWLIYVN